MKFRARKMFRIGSPRFCVRFNFTQAGYSGWGLHIWRWTYSNRTGKSSFDTPGLGHVVFGGRKRGQK